MILYSGRRHSESELPEDHRNERKAMLRYLFMTLVLLLFSIQAAAQTSAGRIWYDLGVFALDAGEYEKAENYAHRALDADEDNPEYQHLLGKIHLNTERYEKARSRLKKAYQTDPSLYGLKYDLGYACYKTSDFERAAQLLTEIAGDDPSNVPAVYYSGICLFNLDRFDDALPYFIDSAEKSPNASANSRYYAGICYVKTGNSGKALEMFEYVRENADSKNLKESADKWIDALKSRDRGDKPYYLFLKLGFQYDDNVGLDPPDRDFDKEFNEEDDWMSTVFFSSGWDFFKRNGLIFGGGYNHYQSWYLDTNEYNLTASMFRLYSSYAMQPFVLSLEYSPSAYRVDNEAFLTSHRIKPSAAWKMSENIEVGAYYRFTNNDYEDNERDGNANGMFLNLTWKAAVDFKVFAEAGYEKTSADYDIYANDLFEANLIATYELPLKTSLRVAGHTANRRYDETIPEYDTSREDDGFSISASLSHNLIVDWLKAELMYEYSENRSNIDHYDYKRNLAGISISGVY